MAKDHQDLRVVRTDKAIKHAFEDMLIAGIRPIKVSELATRAGINRKTFYSHYDTIEDLAHSYIEDAQDALYRRLETHRVKDYLSKRGLLVGVFADFIEENRHFYRNILFQGDYWPILQRVQDEFTTGLAARLAVETHLSADEATLVVGYTLNTMLMMFRLNMAGQLHLSTADFREKAEQLIIPGLQGVVKAKI